MELLQLAEGVLNMFRIGGPYALSALLFVAWVWERRENKGLQQTILEQGIAQTKISTQNEAMLKSLHDLLNHILQRL